jgi:hypothetical protein
MDDAGIRRKRRRRIGVLLIAVCVVAFGFAALTWVYSSGAAGKPLPVFGTGLGSHAKAILKTIDTNGEIRTALRRYTPWFGPAPAAVRKTAPEKGTGQGKGAGQDRQPGSSASN